MQEVLTGESVGVVKLQRLSLALPPGGLVLEKGGVLPGVEVAFETCGTLAPDRSNVVYVCHALTGDAHVAGIREGETQPSGWWEGMVGPGRGIDTRYYFVVCANILGGCKGTTGPSSIDPSTGRPYGSAFPEITVADIVTVQHLLLEQLGIRKLAAVVGGSFGGMQALEWAVRYPTAVERCIVIAASASLNAQALAFDIVGRRAITHDPCWNNGDYYAGARPKTGLAQARRIAHITYLSQELMSGKFGRERRPEWVNAGADFHAEARRNFRTTFQIESYLDYQGEKFTGRFDANSYLHITRAMDEYDLAERHGSLETAFAPVQCRVMVISLSGDWLFTPEQSEEIVQAMLSLRKSVSYCHLNAPAGHDAFLTHIDQLKRVIHAFLPWVGERSAPAAGAVERHRSLEYDRVLEMVSPGSRVLDLGCGDGRLLRLLAEQREATGEGIEIDFDRVVEAIDGGCNTLLLDIDEGLALVPDDSYDTVILSETLQAMRRPREVLKEILRVARCAIITFPNFGHLPVRLKLLGTGRMPKSRDLPFEWYETPNIHLFTLSDFVALCKAEGIAVKEMRYLTPGPVSRLLVALGIRNAGADRIIACIARG